MIKIRSMRLITIILIFTLVYSCNTSENTPNMTNEVNVLFLHHSTGAVIWNSNSPSLLLKVIRRISPSLFNKLAKKPQLPLMFNKYNKKNHTNYKVKDIEFPKRSPYGWNNFPYDYYNIWVKNAGKEPYMEEPTLEMLTKKYNVIIFKHCFPVSNIIEDQDTADINSQLKTLSNYKLQYMALREKLHQFPDTKFILFTGASLVKSQISEAEAIRAKKFFDWVISQWDLPDDNIYIWDLYSLETENNLYFNTKYSVSPNDSHPGRSFAKKAGKLLFQRTIDIIENNGKKTQLTGISK